MPMSALSIPRRLALVWRAPGWGPLIAITREEMNVKLTIRLTTLLLAGTILGTGCVASGTYKAKVADLDKAMKEEDALKQEWLVYDSWLAEWQWERHGGVHVQGRNRQPFGGRLS
jgi:hypothetical protein